MKLIVAGQKQAEVREFTYWNEWKYSPHELVLLNILVEFDNFGKSFILDEKTLRVGFSYSGHSTFGNMFQSLFVISTANSVM